MKFGANWLSWHLFRTVFHCLICAYFSLDSDEATFSLEKAILWIDESYFSQKQWFEFIKVLIMGLFLTNTQVFALQDVNFRNGVLSITWTLILTAPIHCRGSTGEQVMLNFSNKLIYILDGQRVSTFAGNVHFWVKNCFKLSHAHGGFTLLYKWK